MSADQFEDNIPKEVEDIKAFVRDVLDERKKLNDKNVWFFIQRAFQEHDFFEFTLKELKVSRNEMFRKIDAPIDFSELDLNPDGFIEKHTKLIKDVNLANRNDFAYQVNLSDLIIYLGREQKLFLYLKSLNDLMIQIINYELKTFHVNEKKTKVLESLVKLMEEQILLFLNDVNSFNGKAVELNKKILQGKEDLKNANELKKNFDEYLLNSKEELNLNNRIIDFDEKNDSIQPKEEKIENVEEELEDDDDEEIFGKE